MERRIFVKTGALVATAVASMPAFVAAQGAGPLRRNVSRLQANDPDISLYKQAVALLKALPPSDPRNWRRLASIHDMHCPHSNWWFLPWHRAYLWFFEETCRDVLQNPAFRLPYWDWTRFPRIPAPFWDAPLAHPRNMTPNDSISSEFAGASVITDIVDSAAIVTLYSAATRTDNQRENAGSGRLESAPHNTVHSTIGRDMVSLMSPLDPIFWLHHANIDRIWASAMRDSSKRFPAETLWGNHELSSFFDPAQKKMVNPRTAETLNASAWGAQYEAYEISQKATSVALVTDGFTFGVAVNNAASASNLGRIFSTSSAIAVAPVALNKAVRAVVPLSEQLARVLEVVPKSAAVPAKASPEASLVIEGIQQPALTTGALRVFLNCKNPSVTTPIDDPSYVGSVSFFGHAAAGHEGHAKFNFVLDIGSTLERLSALGQYDAKAPIDVSLIAIDSRNPGKPSGGEVLKPEGVRIIGVL